MHDANCHATHICGKLNFKRCTGEAQFRRRRVAVAGKTDAYLLSVIRGHRQTDDRQTDASTKIKAEKTPFSNTPSQSGKYQLCGTAHTDDRIAIVFINKHAQQNIPIGFGEG